MSVMEDESKKKASVAKGSIGAVGKGSKEKGKQFQHHVTIMVAGIISKQSTQQTHSSITRSM